jgi:predicted nucleic acid-binding protein
MGLMTPVPIYLDTNALIAIIERRVLIELAEAVVDRTVKLVTSELTLAETLVRPIQTGDAELVRAYEEALSDPDFIETVPVGRELLVEVAENRAATGNKLPDAVHVVTALRTGCPFLVSSDRRLRMPAGVTCVTVETAANRRSWPW